ADADALAELQEVHGVTIDRMPDAALAKILEAWEVIAGEEAEKDPVFGKVPDSRRDYAGKIVPARRFVYAPHALGANRYCPVEKQPHRLPPGHIPSPYDATGAQRRDAVGVVTQHVAQDLVRMLSQGRCRAGIADGGVGQAQRRGDRLVAAGR